MGCAPRQVGVARSLRGCPACPRPDGHRDCRRGVPQLQISPLAGLKKTEPDTGAVLYSLYIVGGGGTTGEKSSIYGATPFNWEVTDLTFNVGDTVAFTVIPTDDPMQSHTFSILEFGTIARMKYGKSATATLTFDKPGRFRYWCDFHSGEGMNGVITVQ